MSKPSHTDETRPLPEKGTYTGLSPPSTEMMKQDHQEGHLHHHESPFLQG